MENVIKMFNSKKAEKFVMVNYSSQKNGIDVFEYSVGNTEEEVFNNVDTSKDFSLFNIDLKEEWKEYCESENEDITLDEYVELLNKNKSHGNTIKYKEGDFYYKCADCSTYILFQNEIDYNECLEMAGSVSHCTCSQPKYKIVPVSEVIENQHKYNVSEEFVHEFMDRESANKKLIESINKLKNKKTTVYDLVDLVTDEINEIMYYNTPDLYDDNIESFVFENNSLSFKLSTMNEDYLNVNFEVKEDLGTVDVASIKVTGADIV